MKRILFLVVIAFIETQAIGQKANTSSAFYYLQNYFDKKITDTEGATKELLEAKANIDRSWGIEEWRNDGKTCMVYGKIYMEITLWAEMSGNQELTKLDLKKCEEDAFAAFDRCMELGESNVRDKRWADEVSDYFNHFYVQLKNEGTREYENKNWDKASHMLISGAEISKYIGVIDTTAFYFGGLAAFKIENYPMSEFGFKKCIEYNFEYPSSLHFYTQSVIKQGRFREVEDMLNTEIAKNSKNLEAMIELINFYIDRDKKEKAIAPLTKAINLTPNNPQLLYTAGSIYDNLRNFEAAEKLYLRCLELEPNNANAAFSLGGLYFNAGADLNNAANKMNPSDPRYNETLKRSEGFLNKAIPFLERAYELEPAGTIILESLVQAYKITGNTKKEEETRAKIQALKG